MMRIRAWLARWRQPQDSRLSHQEATARSDRALTWDGALLGLAPGEQYRITYSHLDRHYFNHPELGPLRWVVHFEDTQGKPVLRWYNLDKERLDLMWHALPDEQLQAWQRSRAERQAHAESEA